MRSCFIIVFATMLLAACIVPSAAQNGDKGPVGLSNMQHFELLPYLWRGTTAAGASSYDRSDGNDDRSRYVYETSSEQVFMDVRGPGCVYRLWITSLDTSHELRFYFDNDTAPRFRATIASFFSGTLAQFPAPLVGYSSGGYYCWVPMPFRERCRIAVGKNNNTWFYYNVGYTRYADANGVTTWTGQEDSLAVKTLWGSPSNPNPQPQDQAVQGMSDVAPGTQQVLADVSGPAQVRALAIRIPQIVPNNATSTQLLRDVRVRAYWDDQQEPAVDAPIGEFFGCGLGEYNVTSLPVKMSAVDGDYYNCFFPMPFGSRARIVLVNGSSQTLTNVDWIVSIGAMPNAAQQLAAGEVGYFHAVSHSENPTTTDDDYTILQTGGRGCFVGCVMTLKGIIDDKNYLEGDERIHIDGSATPAIYGTGTEDFFSGGWYFKNGPFTRQSHGNPAQESGPTPRNACYRLFLSDKLPYYGSIRVRLEHGNTNDINADYSSVAFYYEVGPSGIELTDELDIGSVDSQTAHGYSHTGETWSGTVSKRYPGDDPALIADDGRRFSGECRFTASIDPANAGVKLRRRMDYAMAEQQAAVYVDGALAGYWYDAGSADRWRDSDFEIPGSLTSGKSTIQVRLVSSQWSEFRYRVYSYVDQDNRAPDAVRDFRAMPVDGGVYLRWTGPKQPDLKGVMVRCKTNGYPQSPTDGELVCDVPTWAEEAGQFTQRGLPGGVTYYYAAFAHDGSPNYSPAAQSSSATGTPTCGSARMFVDGCTVPLGAKVVTGVFPDEPSIYVADLDGATGIRINSSQTGLAVGDVVDVTGRIGSRVLSGYECERQLYDATLTKLSGGSIPRAIAMGCGSVGGGPGAGMPGVAGGIGLNNTGMLVKIAGKVTYKSGYYIFVDDGSRVPNLFGVSVPATGVMVKCATTPDVAVGDVVSAVGVIQGSIPLNWTINRALIRARFANDVVALRQKQAEP